MATQTLENDTLPEPRRRWNVKRLMLVVGIEILILVTIGVTLLYASASVYEMFRNMHRCCAGEF